MEEEREFDPKGERMLIQEKEEKNKDMEKEKGTKGEE